MENLIEAIRIALRDDAEPNARRAGLVACRELLTVLETATADEPAASTAPLPSAPPLDLPAAPVSNAPPAPPFDPAAIATVVASLGKLPPEQLLDLAIARLRAALPPNASIPAPQPLRFHIVPLHPLGRSK